MGMSVYVSVCLSVREDTSRTTRAILANFWAYMLPMSVARSSDMFLTIDRIVCRREEGDRSAERGRSVVYDLCCKVIR